MSYERCADCGREVMIKTPRLRQYRCEDCGQTFMAEHDPVLERCGYFPACPDCWDRLPGNQKS